MLSYALTIHKSQGLTLPAVVIDAGDDESPVGLYFVAVTRVRSIEHIAFEPAPSLERITDVIRRKKLLIDRKQHETALRVLAGKYFF